MTTERIDVLAVMPEWCDSMVRVTKDSFYAVVGQLNVTPDPFGRHDMVLGYRSDWKLPHGELIARSIGGTTFCDRAYFVTTGFYDNNRAALARVGGEK